MDKNNNAAQKVIAKVSEMELSQIQALEKQLGEKYYLIAFERSNK